jgi:hypothetical protein
VREEDEQKALNLIAQSRREVAVSPVADDPDDDETKA